MTEADFHSYVSACNAALSPLDLEIRSSRPQTTSPHRQPLVYAIVNATSDALTQIATTHSPDEIAFVKRLLDAMFETHNTRRAEVLALTSMQAINLHKASPRSRDSGIGAGGAGATETQGSSGASLTMAQAQKVLDDLVEEGWFEKSAKGFLSLSPRALMELRGWLIETYNEPTGGDDSDDEGVERVKMCEACREIVTVVSIALSQGIMSTIWTQGKVCLHHCYNLRVNAAPIATAVVGCMMLVSVSSSVRCPTRDVLSVKPSGRKRTSLASVQPNRRIVTARVPQRSLLLQGGRRCTPWMTMNQNNQDEGGSLEKRRLIVELVLGRGRSVNF